MSPRHTLDSDPVPISAGERVKLQRLVDRDSAWVTPGAREACRDIVSRIPFAGGTITRKMSKALQEFENRARRLPGTLEEVLPTDPTEMETPMPAVEPSPLPHDVRLNYGQLAELYALTATQLQKLIACPTFPAPVEGATARTHKSRKWSQAAVLAWVAAHPDSLAQKPHRRSPRVALQDRIEDLEARIERLEEIAASLGKPA